MKNNEQDEKSDIKLEEEDKIDDKKDNNKRSDILRKAREAKKRKHDEKTNFEEHYNKNLENIHAHLKNLNTQINTIVSCINTPSPQIGSAARIEKVVERQGDSPEKESAVVGSYLSEDFSYKLGEMIGLFVVAGGLYYFKGIHNKDPRDKYSGLL
jgi:hypothetical protein